MMTKQEYLDLIVRTSLAGRFPAYDKKKAECKYRMPNGNKCFVGLILPDEKYYPELEGKTADDRDILELVDTPVGVTPGELLEIQKVHDNIAYAGDEWNHTNLVRKLLALSCFAGMTPTPIEEKPC
jgi:hypothetical protein